MEVGRASMGTQEGDDVPPNASLGYNPAVTADVSSYGDLEPPECILGSSDEAAATEAPAAVPLTELPVQEPTHPLAVQQGLQPQPPRQKKKSSTASDLAALLEEQKLLREDLRAARAREFDLRERQLTMLEKLCDAMVRYFDRQ